MTNKVNKYIISAAFVATMAAAGSNNAAAMASYGQEHVDPYAGFPTTYTQSYNNNPYATGKFAPQPAPMPQVQPQVQQMQPIPMQPQQLTQQQIQQMQQMQMQQMQMQPQQQMQYGQAPNLPYAAQPQPQQMPQQFGVATPSNMAVPQIPTGVPNADVRYGASPYVGNNPAYQGGANATGSGSKDFQLFSKKKGAAAAASKTGAKRSSYTYLGLMYPMIDDPSISGQDASAGTAFGLNFSIGSDVGYNLDLELEAAGKYSSTDAGNLDADYFAAAGLVNLIYSPKFAEFGNYQIFGGFGIGYGAAQLGEDVDGNGFATQYQFGIKRGFGSGQGVVRYKYYAGPDVDGDIEGKKVSFSDSQGILELGYIF